MIRRTALSSLTLLALAAGSAHAADLTLCVDRSSPMAQTDVSVAQAVAAQDHVHAKIHYFDGAGDGDDDGFDLKEFATLAKSSCDLVMGFPIDSDTTEVPAGLNATMPYGHTGFMLVLPTKNTATSLSDMGKGTRIAVTYQTTPNLFFVAHPGLVADVHLTDDEGLAALDKGSVGAAMLWGPTVAKHLKAAKESARFRSVELAEPHARFNLVALYDPQHAAAAKQFETAVAALDADGRLGRLLSPMATAGAAKHSPSRSADQRNALWRNPRGAAGDATCATTTAKPPTLFTAAQADSGATKYADNCAQCHGPTLEGRAGPALKGKHFASPAANFHVGDIFTIVSQNMPATQPASLPQDDYVEIMAFLLRENGYPAGSTKLTFDEAKQSKVPLISNVN